MRVMSRYVCNQHDAGPKAKVDVERILRKEYSAKICTYKLKDLNNNIIEKIKKIYFCIINSSLSDIVIVQFPFINYKWPLIGIKNKYGFIHDIEGIRYDDKKILRKEVKVLNSFRGIVVHNNTMKNYLIRNGLKTKCIVLEFFDYLCDHNSNTNNNYDDKIELIYPGNWSKNKAEFLYQLDEDKMNFIINTYGPNTNGDKLKCSKVIFKGSYPPDKLLEKMEGNLGLVWSGKMDDSDKNEGDKRYNLYNYPHKMSCFIAANIPVVVWSKSASAETVKKYNIGYLIDNIYEINNLDLSDYHIKKKNVEELGKKIRTGYFTKRSINELLKGSN